MAPFSTWSCLNKAPRNSDSCVLLLDEDEDFRNGLAEHLRDDGYVVRECAVTTDLPPLDALRDVNLVITDYQLAGDDGLRFSDRFHHSHPRVPIVMVTSFWTHHLEAASRRRNFLHLLLKPLEYTELFALIGRLTPRPRRPRPLLM